MPISYKMLNAIPKHLIYVYFIIIYKVYEYCHAGIILQIRTACTLYLSPGS